jgi:ParB family chromosome partitioning protein
MASRKTTKSPASSTSKTATKATPKPVAKKKRRLGMGLSGMIGSPVEVTPTRVPAAKEALAATPKGPVAQPAHAHKPILSPPQVGVQSDAATTDSSFLHIEVGSIRPNDRQPRQAIIDSSLEPLIASIRTAGVMQPVVVRPSGPDGRHELVAGERRWRAATAAGLSSVPAIVHDIDDQTAAEWAIIENVQREDLDAIERANAFQLLQAEFGLTHSEIADQVGLTRAAVTNQIRLCDLDNDTKSLIRQGALTAGHGRCLLAISTATSRLDFAKQTIKEEWSVRELERRVRSATRSPATSPKAATASDNHRSHLDDLEQQLAQHLGTKVRIITGRKRDRGRLVIEFYDLDQFDGLLGRMGFTST